MLVKSVIIFLALMALLAMVGKAIARAKGAGQTRLGVAKNMACPQCGKRDLAGAVLGRKACGCGAK